MEYKLNCKWTGSLCRNNESIDNVHAVKPRGECTGLRITEHTGEEIHGKQTGRYTRNNLKRARCNGKAKSQKKKKKKRLLGSCGERRNIPTRNPKVIHRIVYSGTGLKLGMHGNAHLEINEGKYRKRTAYMSASTADKQISVLVRGSYPSLILNLRTV